jgi:hypothetical protein
VTDRQKARVVEEVLGGPRAKRLPKYRMRRQPRSGRWRVEYRMWWHFVWSDLCPNGDPDTREDALERIKADIKLRNDRSASWQYINPETL